MLSLGLSIDGRHAAAVVVRDGRPVVGMHDESCSDVSGDVALPVRAVRTCLRHVGSPAEAFDAIVVAQKPLRAFERVLVTQLAAYPRNGRAFGHNVHDWLARRLWVRSRLAAELGVAPERVLFVDRHRALSTAAGWCSPFDEAAVLGVDTQGEWAAAAVSRWRDGAIERVVEVRHPHDLMHVAASAGAVLDLEPGEAVAALEMLARGGDGADFAADVEALVRSGDDGSFSLARELVRSVEPDGRASARVWRERWGEAGLADGRRHDFARGVVDGMSAALADLARTAAARTGATALCLAGDLADRPWLNAHLCALGAFEQVWSLPATSDGGAALGAALCGAQGDGAAPSAANGRSPDAPDVDWGLGPDLFESEADDEHGERDDVAWTRSELADDEAVIDELVRRLEQGALCGWARGRHPFTSAEQGTRCALARPADDQAGARLLAALRCTPWTALTLVLTAEEAERFVELPRGAGPLAVEGRIAAPVRASGDLDLTRFTAPDGTAPVRIVAVDADPLLHALLLRARAAWGAGVLLATPLTTPGRPLPASAGAVRERLARSTLDVLIADRSVFDRTASARSS